MRLNSARTNRSIAFSEPCTWVLFWFAIFVVKVLLLAVDPLPKFMMGDSGTYLYTALTGLIPADRSFLYGLVIRWSSLWTGSLTSLLVLQLCLSAVTAIVFTAIIRFIFGLSLRFSYLLGLLCALDPLQLLYERYVMTEAISLCLYAVMLHRAFLYIRDRRLMDLVLVQVVSVILIAFRISYLMLVEIDTVLLPLIGFSGLAWHCFRSRASRALRWRPIQACGGHLAVSIAVALLLHTNYKHVNGWLSHRQPSYLYATGVTLLAFCSPALEPEDSTDPALRQLIQDGDRLGLKNFHTRNAQRFSPNGLVARLKAVDGARLDIDELARRTAIHALKRNPVGVAKIAWSVYADYWNVATMKRSVEADFSFRRPPKGELVSLLASRFHLAYDEALQHESVLQRYYEWAWPYYFVLLLAPFPAGIALFLSRGRKYAVLVFTHISVILPVAMLFGGDSVRLLQPISLATLLVAALLLAATLEWRNARKQARVERGGAGGDALDDGVHASQQGRILTS